MKEYMVCLPQSMFTSWDIPVTITWSAKEQNEGADIFFLYDNKRHHGPGGRQSGRETVVQAAGM